MYCSRILPLGSKRYSVVFVHQPSKDFVQVGDIVSVREIGGSRYLIRASDLSAHKACQDNGYVVLDEPPPMLEPKSQ